MTTIHTVVLYTEGGITVESFTTPEAATKRLEEVFKELGQNPDFYSVEVCQNQLVTA